MMLKLALEGKRSGAIGARFGVSSASVNRAVNQERLSLIARSVSVSDGVSEQDSTQ